MMVLTIVFLFCSAMCELALPAYMADIVDKGIIGQDQGYILRTGLLMVGLTILAMLFTAGCMFFSAQASAKGARDIRAALFDRVTEFASAEMDRFSTASLITRSTNDVQMIQQATVMLMRLACFAPIMGVGAVIQAVRTSPSLSWTIALALVVILGIMVVAFLAVLPKFRVLQSKLDRLNLIIKERLSGMLVIRAFTKEASEEARFDEANLDLTRVNLFINRAMSFLMPLLFFVMNAVCVLIVWAGAHLISTSELEVGSMMAFIQYTMQIIMSFLFVTLIFIMLPRALVSVGRISEVLSVEPSIGNSKTPAPLTEPRGMISFNNVSFAYPDADENVLDNISFVARPGETTAIIGGTGSGKSTLLNLIPRFYDVTGGEVLFDGKDIRNLDTRELRNEIGYIPQKGVLFSGTIESNIRYGKEDASAEEILEAAKISQSEEFIDEKPEGIDTEVSQGGTTVSGGQKQRLAIARALIKKPKVYLFDDSFSALDFKTDNELRKALKETTGDSTFIIVAQRINTVLDADQILVLDEGRLAGKGTHEELMETCDVYREIATSQVSDEELGRRGA